MGENMKNRVRLENGKKKSITFGINCSYKLTFMRKFWGMG